MMITAAMAVRLEGGGVIFRQVRVGRDGKQFELLKFRSMRPADETESQTKWCVATDARVGAVRTAPRCTWVFLSCGTYFGRYDAGGSETRTAAFVELFSAQYDRYAQRHRVQAEMSALDSLNHFNFSGGSSMGLLRCSTKSMEVPPAASPA